MLVFRTGVWYLRNTNATGFADVAINYGQGGDYPVVGDWDGNGTTTIGIYRNGTFYLRNSNTDGFAEIAFDFNPTGNTSGVQPVAGDWDGDGIDTIGIYQNGTFYLRNSNSAGAADYGYSLGVLGDLAIAGDWNGDGRDTGGVFRPSNATFYLTNSNDQGWADVAFGYGWSNGKPVAGDWNSDGIDTIGLFNTSDGKFYLRNANSAGGADLVFAFGNTTDVPLAGNWDGQPLMLPPTPTPTSTPNPSSPLNASFVYDGDGQRVKSALTTGSGTTTTYFVGAHYEVANGVVTKYYYAGAQRIATLAPALRARRSAGVRTNGTLKFLLGDHLGSTSLVTDAAGNNVIETRYKAWGEVRYASGSTPTDYTYTGQYSDSYINLLWYGSRHYDPELGRFIQPDSIVPTTTQGVQAWDRYAYVNNAPTRYTDPTGHRACGDGEGINCETGLLNNPKKNANKGCRQGECLGITRNPCLMRRFDCQPKVTEPGGITPSASSNEVIEFTDYGPETMPTINGRRFTPAYGGVHKGLSYVELALMGIDFLHYNTGVYSQFSGNNVQGVIPVVHDNVSGNNIIPGAVVYNDTGYYVLVQGVTINDVYLDAAPSLIPSGGAGGIQFTDPAFLPTAVTEMTVVINFKAYQSNGVFFGSGQSHYDGYIYYGPPPPP